jgi:hypothetical protein
MRNERVGRLPENYHHNSRYETLHPNVGFEQFEYVVLPSSDLQAPAPRDHSQQVVQQQGVVEELNEMASNSNSQPEASNNASSDADESEPARLPQQQATLAK